MEKIKIGKMFRISAIFLLLALMMGLAKAECAVCPGQIPTGTVTVDVIDEDGHHHAGYEYLLIVGHTDDTPVKPSGCGGSWDFAQREPMTLRIGEFYIDKFLGHGAGDGCCGGNRIPGAITCTVGYGSMQVVSKDASGNTIPEGTSTVNAGGIWSVRGKLVSGGTVAFTFTLKYC